MRYLLEPVTHSITSMALVQEGEKEDKISSCVQRDVETDYHLNQLANNNQQDKPMGKRGKSKSITQKDNKKENQDRIGEKKKKNEKKDW